MCRSGNRAGDRLGVLGRDPFLRVWDVSAGAGEVKEVWKARVQRGLKGAVAFIPDGKWVTQVTFQEAGTYVLRAVASDGSLFTYDNVTVTVTR